jgi:hypothetical protein
MSGLWMMTGEGCSPGIQHTIAGVHFAVDSPLES